MHVPQVVKLVSVFIYKQGLKKKRDWNPLLCSLARLPVRRDEGDRAGVPAEATVAAVLGEVRSALQMTAMLTDDHFPTTYSTPIKALFRARSIIEPSAWL